ncbi:hypothetical protein D3C76_1759200 [compost metagenome]
MNPLAVATTDSGMVLRDFEMMSVEINPAMAVTIVMYVINVAMLPEEPMRYRKKATSTPNTEAIIRSLPAGIRSSR